MRPESPKMKRSDDGLIENDPKLEKVAFAGILAQADKSIMMKNKLSSIDTELEKDRLKGKEMRELNDAEKFNLTGPF